VLHRLFNLRTVASTLPCVAATVALVRSYSTGDVFSVARVSTSGDVTYRRHDQLHVGSGVAVFSHRFYSARGPAARAYAVQWARPGGRSGPSTFHQVARPDMRMDLGPGGKRVSVCGFHFARSNYPRADGTVCLAGRYAAIPLWSPVALTASLPAVRLLGLCRARRRVRTGRCAACGYDLRASSGRCPECGTSIPADDRPAVTAFTPPTVTA
jgi:hypothetical protein